MGRVVPWVSWDEWEQTAAALLSWQRADVRRGIDRVGGSDQWEVEFPRTHTTTTERPCPPPLASLQRHPTG